MDDTLPKKCFDEKQKRLTVPLKFNLKSVLKGRSDPNSYSFFFDIFVPLLEKKSTFNEKFMTATKDEEILSISSEAFGLCGSRKSEHRPISIISYPVNQLDLNLPTISPNKMVTSGNTSAIGLDFGRLDMMLDFSPFNRPVTMSPGCVSVLIRTVEAVVANRSCLPSSILRIASSSASLRILSLTWDGNMEATMAEVLTAMAMTFCCRCRLTYTKMRKTMPVKTKSPASPRAKYSGRLEM